MIKLLLIVRYKFGYMVPNNRAGTPEVISPFWHFILVLLGPSVLTSTQWVSDRVRTSPRDTTLLNCITAATQPLPWPVSTGSHVNGPSWIATPLLSFGQPPHPTPVTQCGLGWPVWLPSPYPIVHSLAGHHTDAHCLLCYFSSWLTWKQHLHRTQEGPVNQVSS